MSEELPEIPTERQLKKKQRPKISKGDRVGAKAENWYNAGHEVACKFPIMHGTVISVTDFSANVFWDVDEMQSPIGIDKLEILPDGAEFQDNKIINNPSIFKKKSSGKKKATAVVRNIRSRKDTDDYQPSSDDPSPSEEAQLSRSPIKIVNKKTHKNLKKTFTKVVTQSSTEKGKPKIVNQKKKPTGKQKLLSKKCSGGESVQPGVKTTDIERSEDTDSDSSESEFESDLDASEHSEAEPSSSKKAPKTAEERLAERLKAEKDFGWKEGERVIDVRCSVQGNTVDYGPRLKNYDPTKTSVLDYFCHFFPFKYLRETVLPFTNKKGQDLYGSGVWKELTVGEFCLWLGVRFTQLYIKLPNIVEYWNTTTDGVFPALDMGRYISRTRFFQINAALTLAETDDTEEQVITLIKKLNETFQEAITPGSCLTVDESMIASRHIGLRGQKKIKRKPRPVGIEIKNLADSRSKINLVLEKNQEKSVMAKMPYVDQFGATTATTLRLTEPYHGSGRVVFGDSWFGSVKTCMELKKVGIYSTVVVKTAHKNFPKEIFMTMGAVNQGEFKSLELKDQGLIAVKYMDIKEKSLVSSFSTTIPGKPRIKISKRTKEKTIIPRPKIFSEYCEQAGAIDIYKHYRTGGTGLEDSWKTISPLLRQFAGLLGFVETNAFLAKKFFEDKAFDHGQFRKNLANELLTNSLDKATLGLVLRYKGKQRLAEDHRLERMLSKQKCFSCSNKGELRVEHKTIWCCACTGPKRPICSPNTGRNCYTDHVETGLFPTKKYRKKVMA